MINVLYIGNNLKNKRSNISGIQTLGALLEGEGFKMYYASSISNKILRLLDMLWCVFKLQHKVDYVLIDTYSTQNFYYAFLVSQCCRLFKVSYIPILHGGHLASRLENSPKLSTAIFKNALHNVSPSLFLKDTFQKYGFKTVHISNTIEIENYPIVKKVYEAPKLLWVRSFSEIYNPKLAIRVFHKLKELYPTATLCMIGPDTDGTGIAVKKLALELQLDVVFTGKLTKSEWISHSKQYNVFINTTNVDNTPVSVIEAMALGFPIVTTNVGGLPYLITHSDNGLLVEPNDVNAMVEAIIQIQTDQNLRSALITNARKKSEQFAWKHIKQKWESLLS